MFSFGAMKQKCVELDEARLKIIQLESQLNFQTSLAENRLKELTELKNEIEDKSRACTAFVDFYMMDAFSIERLNGRDKLDARTVIGYLSSSPESKPEVAEWTIYCNEEIHEQLVAEFKKAASDRTFKD